MSNSILLAIYMVAVLAVSWVESKAIVGLHLGESLGSLLYAILSNFICSVVAPVAALASIAAGFFGVFNAINNTKGITTNDAFGSYAAPMALVALIIIAAVRVLPLLLMNLRRPFRAVFYSVLSTVVLGVGFTIGGIALISVMSGAANPH